MKRLALALTLACLATHSQAAILDFNNQNQLGVTLGWPLVWNSDADNNGYIYRSNIYGNSTIAFGQSTFVNSFQMNELPWAGYGGTSGNGLMDIAAYDSSSHLLWSTTVNLSNYTDWTRSDWLTVPVGVANVENLTFFSPMDTHGNYLWPSIDNMVINEVGSVPEPATLIIWTVLGAGAAGLALRRRQDTGRWSAEDRQAIYAMLDGKLRH